jgi:hypothetical protein
MARWDGEQSQRIGLDPQEVVVFLRLSECDVRMPSRRDRDPKG